MLEGTVSGHAKSQCYLLTAGICGTVYTLGYLHASAAWSSVAIGISNKGFKCQLARRGARQHVQSRSDAIETPKKESRCQLAVACC